MTLRLLERQLQIKQRSLSNEMNTEDNKIILRGELALVVMVVLNSMGVLLMLHSGSGISAISSVPYAFQQVFPQLSLGTWTYIFQGFLVLVLMVLSRRFVPAYLFSFVVGFVFGELMDLEEPFIDQLPLSIPLRVFYFVLSYLILCFGIALGNRCHLPITPTDLFPRELSHLIQKPYARVKITFDLTCLITTAVITMIGLGHIQGLGIGTVVAACTMGKGISMIGSLMDKRFVFHSVLSKRSSVN